MDYLYAVPGHRWPAAKSFLEDRLVPTQWRLAGEVESPPGHVMLSFTTADDRQILHEALDESLSRSQLVDPSAGLRSLVGSGIRLTVAAPTRAKGWLNYDSAPGPEVDQVGPLHDYAVFGDGMVSSIYCVHVLARLPHDGTVTRALTEFHRILAPGGELRLSVPDLDRLFRMFLEPDRDLASKQRLIHHIFGSQATPVERHLTGFDEATLTSMLRHTGFTDVERVGGFGLFLDASEHRYAGQPTSLNVKAVKPA